MKKRIILILLAVVALVTFLVVPISAVTESEEIETQSIYESIFDLPGSNLIPYPYEFSQDDVWDSELGVTVTNNYDGSIILNGEADEEIFIVLAYMELSKGTYYLSGFPEGFEQSAYIAISDFEGLEYFEDCGTGCLVNIKDNTLTVCLELYIEAGCVFTDTIIYPMLNKGNTAAPYQSYLPYDFGYQKGFNEGYLLGSDIGYGNGKADGFTAGREQGWTEGYNDGYAYGKNIGFKEGEQSEVTDNFLTIISEIAFAPYNAISTMFDFEIFGINIAGLIFQLFTALVVLLIAGLAFKYLF